MTIQVLDFFISIMIVTRSPGLYTSLSAFNFSCGFSRTSFSELLPLAARPKKENLQEGLLGGGIFGRKFSKLGELIHCELFDEYVRRCVLIEVLQQLRNW